MKQASVKPDAVNDVRNTKDLDAAIRNCGECHAICLRTCTYCLQHGEAMADVDFIGGLQVCADLCRVCADAMIRGSELHSILCGACAEVCACCAASCEMLEDDPQVKECRSVCLRCFDSCSAMASEAA
jgi:hypothetical protein